jgi:hypothetical protein
VTIAFRPLLEARADCNLVLFYGIVNRISEKRHPVQTAGLKLFGKLDFKRSAALAAARFDLMAGVRELFLPVQGAIGQPPRHSAVTMAAASLAANQDTTAPRKIALAIENAAMIVLRRERAIAVFASAMTVSTQRSGPPGRQHGAVALISEVQADSLEDQHARCGTGRLVRRSKRAGTAAICLGVGRACETSQGTFDVIMR